ncbi:hypothetical protein DSO57_1011883 [Entomophthora muscae]|uniref:Uncharacterized protein n=1 Tax=Entomophthora muscae TaxID=34485 RepID=A0ACC2RX30_9FUNG|nr:hypothetical protein DSO57_1011883 [Entomophthora muscae]
MTDRRSEFIGNEFTRLLQEWYIPTAGLAPADVQVHGRDACLVIGKVLEEFAVMQAKYKFFINPQPLLENDNSSKPVSGYGPGHTLGTCDQEPHKFPGLDNIMKGYTGSSISEASFYGHSQPACPSPSTTQECVLSPASSSMALFSHHTQAAANQNPLSVMASRTSYLSQGVN